MAFDPKGVTHVAGLFCYRCVRPLTTGLSIVALAALGGGEFVLMHAVGDVTTRANDVQ
jgi:hypothetical protein